jgi:uncharacterized protein
MPNQLAAETSPYLQQHQANPVHWLPWGEEAFDRARRENKPVLVSIGYAACHWCHVMARESFEDVATATFMNERFINVKVDREERPDVDALYIRALQAMNKRAGWPLTMFVTADGSPFWGGTYFPPLEKDGLPAFRDVLEHISAIYTSDAAAVAQKAEKLVDVLLQRSRATHDGAEIGHDTVVSSVEALLREVDWENGGIKGTPKFPFSPFFRFLWNAGCRLARDDCHNAVVMTLNRMIGGGIYDQIGGGFARYAVDRKWVIPHFEKMLYDNAQLIDLLADVWRFKPLPAYRQCIEQTIGWLCREMTLHGGAFAASLAAESDGEEGAFYLWGTNEIDDLLGADAGLFKRIYGVTTVGNFGGRNILHCADSDVPPTPDEEARLARCRGVLLKAREARPQPRRDDKVLADWNGMAIAALAKAAAIFRNDAWLAVAERAFAFVSGSMMHNGGLLHSWCGGKPGTVGILDDYANMIRAALALFENTGRPRYLDTAEQWTDVCLRRFHNDRSSALSLSPSDSRSLVASIIEGNDATTPSGNGVMAEALSRLYFLTGTARFRDAAREIIRAFAGRVTEDDFRLGTILNAWQLLASAVQITVIGPPDDPATQGLRAAADRHGQANQILLTLAPGQHLPPSHPAAAKLVASDRPTAFVCVGTTCSLPVNDPDSLVQVLRSTSWI